MTAPDLLIAAQAALDNEDAVGFDALIAAHPGSRSALQDLRSEHRLKALAATDLTAQGWMTIEEAARYLPYSPVTIRQLLREGTLGPGMRARDDNWPHRTYISPIAVSRLLQRPYKASGPGNGKKKDKP